MKAPNLIALTAAVLFTGLSLATMRTNVEVKAPTKVTQINGIEVVDLPAVIVTPSAEDRRAAALLGNAPLGVAGAMASEGSQLISDQLAMPYYSFGSKFGRISKE